MLTDTRFFLTENGSGGTARHTEVQTPGHAEAPWAEQGNGHGAVAVFLILPPRFLRTSQMGGGSNKAAGQGGLDWDGLSGTAAVAGEERAAALALTYCAR